MLACALGLTSWSNQGAIYKEVNGIVVIEADTSTSERPIRTTVRTG